MEQGLISSSRLTTEIPMGKNVYWCKEKKFLKNVDKIDFGDDFKAFICKKCKIVLFQY